ncbi:MAG TPA: outer membrane beta-barrel protein [Gemmatimonadaceae bacterium]|nr:outer membrane beta-barrel protein [Gemmatimonadaceae bacterium]
MRIQTVVSLVAVALCATTASAQRRTTTVAATPTALELGVDATADIGLGDNSFTVVNIPSGSIRIGFPMTPRVSIEPKGSLSVVSGNGHTQTSYSVQVGALYHFDEKAMQRSGVYVRPTIGLSGASGTASHNTVFGGVGLGLKKPILGQLGARYEAAFLHNFNNGSANELELSAGLSWFTH